jgi:succinoglycan biosynthesis transport protein ExoP
MGNLPKLEQRFLELKRDVTVKENLYLLLLQNFEEAKIAEAAVSGTSTIIDEAVANNSPIKPNKKMLLAVGALLGLFLGTLLVFLIEAFDDSVKD